MFLYYRGVYNSIKGHKRGEGKGKGRRREGEGKGRRRVILLRKLKSNLVSYVRTFTVYILGKRFKPTSIVKAYVEAFHRTEWAENISKDMLETSDRNI